MAQAEQHYLQMSQIPAVLFLAAVKMPASFQIQQPASKSAEQAATKSAGQVVA